MYIGGCDMHDNRLPVISVVIPVYCAEKYIAQTLESVLAQPYPNIQIICVDDGSPDDSISILQDYSQRFRNIHVIRQENAGVSVARNTGIEYVLQGNGGYITFLDADDCWAKDTISEKCVADFSGMDCIGLGSVHCNSTLTHIAPATVQPDQVLVGGASAVFCHSNFPMGAMFYATDLLRRYHIRFIPGLKYSEDQLFKFACLYLAGKIRLLNRVLYLYRSNDSGAMGTRKFGIDYMPQVIQGYLQTEEFLKLYETSTRGTPQFCRVLAGIYTIEMISEHYQKFQANVVLDEFLCSNSYMTDLINNLEDRDLSENHRQLRKLYQDSPHKFRVRSYSIGIKQMIQDAIRRHPIISEKMDSKKYSQQNCYI